MYKLLHIIKGKMKYNSKHIRDAFTEIFALF
jgi:hypothetical protein